MKNLDEFNRWLSQEFLVRPGNPKAYYEKPTHSGDLQRHVYVSYLYGAILAADYPDGMRCLKMTQFEADEALLGRVKFALMSSVYSVPGIGRPTLVMRTRPYFETYQQDIYDESKISLPRTTGQTIPGGYVLDISTDSYKKLLRVETRRKLFMRCVIEEVPAATQESHGTVQGAPIAMINEVPHPSFNGKSVIFLGDSTVQPAPGQTPDMIMRFDGDKEVELKYELGGQVPKSDDMVDPGMLRIGGQVPDVWAQAGGVVYGDSTAFQSAQMAMDPGNAYASLYAYKVFGGAVRVEIPVEQQNWARRRLYDNAPMRYKDHYDEVYTLGSWHPCDALGREIVGIPPVPKVGDIRITDRAVWNGSYWSTPGMIHDRLELVYAKILKDAHEKVVGCSGDSWSAVVKDGEPRLRMRITRESRSQADLLPQRGPNDTNPFARPGSATNPLTEANYAQLVKDNYKSLGEVSMEKQHASDARHNRRLPVTLTSGAKQIKPALSGFDRIKDI